MSTRAWLVTGLLLSVTAALLIGIFFWLNRGVTLNFATNTIERLASERLGRAVSLREAPHLQLGKELRLSISGLRIANASWATDPDFLKLESADIHIDTRSLFSGPTLITRVEIFDADLWLEVTEDGLGNTPGVGEKAPEKPVPKEANKDFSLFFDTVIVRDIHVTRRNQQTGKAAAFSLAQLDKKATPEGITLTADGLLQEHPWALQLKGTAIRELVAGDSVAWSLSGDIADLAFQGEFALPSIDRLADATLSARVSGSLPAEIAALSPLLDPEAPIVITADTRDIDPGVTVDIKVDLPQLKLALTGEIHEPGTGDGLDLLLTADAQSFPRLAAALKLGATADLPLSINARMLRNGSAIDVSELAIQAGEHLISGNGNFPAFPSTDAARLELVASGPDFAFYQRLLQRPVGLPFPYTLTATLNAGSAGIELLDTALRIGEARVNISGSLGNFPSYRGSDLNLQISGPSLQALGDSMALELPPEPYQLNGKLAVSDDNRISVTELNARTVGASLALEGAVNGWPALDDMDMTVRFAIDSLAQTTGLFGLAPLGDIPGVMSLAARGSLTEPDLSDLELVAGGLSASTRGSLRFSASAPSSDLELDVAVDSLPQLLGDYAHPRLPSGPFTFTLSPAIDQGMLSLLLRDLKGPGVSGNAELAIASTLQIDERTRLDMELGFRSLAELLPPLGAYTPADRPLTVSASTRASGNTTRLNATLSSGADQIFTAQLDTSTNAAEGLRIHVEGQGEDIQSLGQLSFAPRSALPYRLNVDARLLNGAWDIEANELSLGGTDARGTIQWSPTQRALRADIAIPKGNLAPWLAHGEPDAPSPSAGKKSGKRLIPDTPLPLNWMTEFSGDIRLSTGPLGIKDPVFEAQSLVDSLQASLTVTEGAAQLSIPDMQGSRGQLSARLSMQPVDDAGAAMLNASLNLEQFPLGITSRARAFADLPRHTVTASLQGKGSTIAELAATLSGELLMVGGSGTLENMSMSFATESFVTQLFSALLPGLEKSDDTQVDCSIVAAQAKEGIVSLDPGLVLRTQRVDLTARGKIDLRDESIGIRFDNQARKGLGISAGSLVNPYVQITGTLAKPSLGLHVTSTAIAGGAAIATGGLTVLARPLYGRFLRRKNPCDTALKHWEER